MVKGFRYAATTWRNQKIRNFIWVPGFFPDGFAKGFAKFLLDRAYRTVQSLEADPYVGLKAPPGDVAIFARQLSLMLKAGIPLHRCLHFLSESPNETLGKASGIVGSQIESGHHFSAALERMPGIFPAAFKNFAKVGENSGKLAETLESLATQLEKSQWAKSRVRGALAYPAFLAVGSVILSLVLIFCIVPSMAPTLMDLGVELPFLTRALLWVVNSASNPYLILFSILYLGYHATALVFGMSEVGRYTNLRTQIDSLLLSIPVVSRLVRRYTSARVMSATALYVEVGIPVARALMDSSPLAGNMILEYRLRLTCQAVGEGVDFAEALEIYDVLSKGEVQVVACALESGNLADSLEILARRAEEEVEDAIDRFTSALEPMIMGVMALVVGTVTLATFLPWIKLIETIS